MANAGVIVVTSDSAPNAWRRFVADLLQAFAASEEPRVLPAPPEPEQIAQAVLRLSGRAAEIGARGDESP